MGNNQLCHSFNKIFLATSSGLNIYNENNELGAYATAVNGFTTVGTSTDYIILGTPHNGLKRLKPENISFNTTLPVNITSSIEDFNITDMTSSGVRYLHISENGLNMTVCTTSGVDLIKFHAGFDYHSKTYLQGCVRCFSAYSSLYYIVSGTNNSGTTSSTEYYLCKQNYSPDNWDEPTKKYNSADGPFIEGLILYDVCVTEVSQTLIYCATSSGIYVIDDSSNNVTILYTTTASGV